MTREHFEEDQRKFRAAAEAPAERGGIGWAVKQLLAGATVARRGWNGRGMFLFLVPGSTFAVSEGRPMAAHYEVGTQINYQPHVDMQTADGSVVPWLCSQTDLLAVDWEIVNAAPKVTPQN